MKKFRVLAVAGAASMVMLGGAVAGTSTATADSHSPRVGSSKCNQHLPDRPEYINTSGVNLRNGPSATKYYSKGQLSKGTKFTFYCEYERSGSDPWDWEYGKVTSGKNKGKKGWVYGKYTTNTGIRHLPIR